MYSDSDNDSTNPIITCTNCQSSNFYRDSSTDNLVCYECHTQSQSQSQREVVDDDDFFNLAAKNASGGYHAKTNRKRNRRVEDHELDRSKALPDVVDCCAAFQVLLKLAAERAVILSGIGDMEVVTDDDDADDDTNGRNGNDLEELAKKAMLTLVKDIWFAYLQSWQNAVEHFGRMFPEVRFSFRDSFLSTPQRGMVYRAISARVLQTIHDAKKLGNDHPGWNGEIGMEDDVNRGTNTTRNQKRTRIKLDLESSNSDTDSCASGSTTQSFRNEDLTKNDTGIIKEKGSNTRYRYYREPLTSVNHMLSQLKPAENRTIDKHEAVLRLNPSMTLIASIVHLALLKLRTGIASFHLTSWAGNGSYPYILNAFVHLPPKLQEKMKPVQKIFVNRTVPHPAEIDQTTDLLVLACDLDMARDQDHEFAKLQRNNFRYCNRKKLTKLFTGQTGIKQIVKDTPKKLKQQNPKPNNEKSISDSRNSTIKENRSDEIFTESGVSRDDSNTLQQNTDEKATKIEVQSSKRNVYQDNIPMMACRFVTDLGLDQRVLDITLALMGLYRPAKTMQQQQQQNNTRSDTDWLPGSLQCAAPDRMVSPLHVMAVIVVACKMCPNWEGWQVRFASDVIDSDAATTSRTKRDTPHNTISLDRGKSPVKGDDDSWTRNLFQKEEDNDDEVETPLKKNKDLKRQRFIPWEDDHLNYVGNGRMLNDYLDFIDETHGLSLPVMEQYRDVVSSIKDLYSSLETHDKKSSKQARKDDPAAAATIISATCGVAQSNRAISIVKPNTVLAGEPNPNKPRRIKRKGTNFFQFLLLRHKGALWADANGFGEYVVYKDMKSHAATKCTTKSRYMRSTPAPFHPHYGLLIEFAADKMSAEPGELHYLVTALDEEISSYGRPDLDWSLHNNTSRNVKLRLMTSEARLKKRVLQS